ncbi:MAG TPA: hypothetical protein VGC29_09310 [Flavisolibacter sp.]
MSRIFSISFPYRNSVFNALITMKGGDDQSTVSLRIENEFLHLLLPHGKLSFRIDEVVSYFTKPGNGQNDLVLPITETISLQLLNTTR